MRNNQLTNIISQSLSFSFLNKKLFKNKLIQSVFQTFLITLITTISGYSLDYIYDINRIFNLKSIFNFFLRYKEKKITINGTRYIEYKYLTARHDFSSRFIALLFKISKCSKDKSNIDSIQSLEELRVKEKVRYSHSDSNDKDNFSYIISQKNNFQLTKDIYAYIKNDCEEVESNSNKNTTSVQKKSYSLNICSKTLSIIELEKFIEECCSEYEEYKIKENSKKKFHFVYNKFTEDDDLILEKHIFSTNRSLDNIFIDNKDEIMKTINTFTEGKDWYKRIGNPWHLGILCYGEPGCGKSSFIKALANDLGRHIKEIPLKRFKKCSELRQVFHCIEYDKINIEPDKCIIVLEDIDCMTDIVKSRKLIQKEKNDMKNKFKSYKEQTKTKEETAIISALEDAIESKKDDDSNSLSSIMKSNINDTDNLNLSFLLNLIDGIMEMPGRIIIMTTNQPDILDEALIRPGRIDIRLNFKKASAKVTEEMINHYYKSMNNQSIIEEFSRLIEDNRLNIVDGRFTPAELMNILQTSNCNVQSVFDKIT